MLAAVVTLRHATPEQVHAYVVDRGEQMSLSTIYRVLEVLEEVGLVRHTHIESGATTYHAADGPPHLHLRCQRCGAVSSLPTEVGEPFAREVEARSGFIPDLTHAGIHGVCRTCQVDS